MYKYLNLLFIVSMNMYSQNNIKYFEEAENYCRQCKINCKYQIVENYFFDVFLQKKDSLEIFVFEKNTVVEPKILLTVDCQTQKLTYQLLPNSDISNDTLLFIKGRLNNWLPDGKFVRYKIGSTQIPYQEGYFFNGKREGI